VVGIGRLLVATMFAMLCRRATEEDLRARGLKWQDVQPRGDQSYWAEINTTFGRVRFPLFAYREFLRVGATVTRAPARGSVFPYSHRSRSSPVLLEWEVRLGAEHPFRRAQQALAFFSHDAVAVEDTTIEHNMVWASPLVEREWLYQPPAEIRRILAEEATRDRDTGRPILYMSSDAHALRRYVDETWDAQWKMTNGIRLWCESAKTGQTIHIGGEYTWGDCRAVAAAFEDLIARGILPADGDYGDGIRAQFAWDSDGMPWFEDHVLPLFKDCLAILDVGHVLKRVGEYLTAILGGWTAEARALYARCVSATGCRSSRSQGRSPKPRRGIPHRRKGTTTPPRPSEGDAGAPNAPHPAEQLAVLLKATCPADEKAVALLEDVLEYVKKNAYRMDYLNYRARGYQIGSGAMESMHRNGSQTRTKVAGARWLQETSQAVFNFRMLLLMGRWDDFWAQTSLDRRLAGLVCPWPVAAPKPCRDGA
jgi:hypothetical protein